jgi:class 3 adenylate cyclase
MHLALEHVDAELERDSSISLANRTDVNTGDVWSVTLLGPTPRHGDALNVAARLEQAVVTSCVLVGESTYRLVRHATK